jgi:molybdopterin/thiamine biosynthesis adenylyltransferase
MQNQLRISGKHYKQLLQHLFPGDGKEAVAVALCGRFERDGISILLTHKLELIPHEECQRDGDYVHWQTDRIIPFLEEVEKKNMAIVKIHCHPGGYPRFSDIDDRSDGELFPSVFSWSETESVHGSAVMLPDGRIFGRVFTKEMEELPFDKVSVSGDAIKTWYHSNNSSLDEFSIRTIQAFGEGTYNRLKKMKVGIIGCSGTGSPLIEQLVRLGVAEIVIADPDLVETKNLNRILNTRMKHVENREKKVFVIKEAIESIGIGTKVTVYDKNLYDSPEALNDLITCDVIFGCVDSVDGRHLLSQLTNFYLLPYFDVGVRLIADGEGNVHTIVASVHYIQPGCSTLLSRKMYDAERLRAEATKRQNPETYQQLLQEKYIQGVEVDRPAVISINMMISSLAVNEFLNRIHLFKDDCPSHYAKVMIDYCGGCIENVSEKRFDQDAYAATWAGRGDCKPFLRMPELSL